MNTKEMLETMYNIYIMELVVWEHEGKHEQVENCLTFSSCIDGYYTTKCRRVEIDDNIRSIIVNNVLTEEEKRWCIGYARSRRYSIIKVENEKVHFSLSPKKNGDIIKERTVFYFY